MPLEFDGDRKNRPHSAILARMRVAGVDSRAAEERRDFKHLRGATALAHFCPMDSRSGPPIGRRDPLRSRRCQFEATPPWSTRLDVRPIWQMLVRDTMLAHRRARGAGMRIDVEVAW